MSIEHSVLFAIHSLFSQRLGFLCFFELTATNFAIGAVDIDIEVAEITQSVFELVE